jgi:hypothetical protein
LKGRLNADEASIQTPAVESMERLAALMQDILTYSELAVTPRPRILAPDCTPEDGTSRALRLGGDFHGETYNREEESRA